MKRICITGANGFIGQSLCKHLSRLNSFVVAIVRDKKFFLNLKNVQYFEVKNFNDKKKWNKLLKNCDYIVHCAGKSSLPENLKNYEKYNSENFIDIKNIAEQAAEVGVKRIILLSSIKIYGEITNINHDNLPKPESFYAVSKLETEKALVKISSKFDLDFVIIRLPLVYGPGAKGNMAKLINIIKLGIPLPFKLITNKRSMIGIHNLLNFLMTCIDNPKASRKIFLVSDEKGLSIQDLVHHISSAMGKNIFMFPFPIFIIKFIFSIFCKQRVLRQLTGSSNININYTKKILGWKPPYSSKEEIIKMVQG